MNEEIQSDKVFTHLLEHVYNLKPMPSLGSCKEIGWLSGPKIEGRIRMVF